MKLVINFPNEMMSNIKIKEIFHVKTCAKILRFSKLFHPSVHRNTQVDSLENFFYPGNAFDLVIQFSTFFPITKIAILDCYANV